MENNNQNGIISAILIVGVLIAGAILLKGSHAPAPKPSGEDGIPVTTATLSPVGQGDRTLGNPSAKVTLVMYEDFQCPWCGKFVKESEQVIRDKYIPNGSVQFVYRDYAFLGPESVQAAEAARCAEDQGKFWEYHDYLFAHQSGENQGNFSDANLETFAKNMGLNPNAFNLCLSTDKYAQAIADSKNEGEKAGVTGTPKGFILKDGKIVDTIDGYLPLDAITQKLDAALK